MFTQIIQFIRGLGWAGAVALSVVLTIASLALAGVIVVHWPADHFKPGARPRFWDQRHPVVRGLGIAGKNLAGLLLVIVGFLMALPGVPGQGFLLLLIGLTLIDFPGKHRLERALIRRHSVLKVVNSVRARFGRPALELE